VNFETVQDRMYVS